MRRSKIETARKNENVQRKLNVFSSEYQDHKQEFTSQQGKNCDDNFVIAAKENYTWKKKITSLENS